MTGASRTPFPPLSHEHATKTTAMQGAYRRPTLTVITFDVPGAGEPETSRRVPAAAVTGRLLPLLRIVVTPF
jgi:hypothetical protein